MQDRAPQWISIKQNMKYVCLGRLQDKLLQEVPRDSLDGSLGIQPWQRLSWTARIQPHTAALLWVFSGQSAALGTGREVGITDS